MKEAPQTSGWATSDDLTGDWSDDDSDNETSADTINTADPLSDLELLLQQRDDAINSTAPAPVATPTGHQHVIVESSTATTNTRLEDYSNTFPALLINVVEEPYEDYTKEHDYSHENELLQSYIRQEEEEKSADVSDLRRIIAGTKNSKGNSADTGVTGANATSGESYERTPAQQRQFMRFQKRVSRCPLQVLRYEYGGEPLWPMPEPRHLKIPKCTCGEQRVFELQLLPTINYFLKVDEYAPHKLNLSTQLSTAVASVGAIPVHAPRGGGMDWSGVFVYSCPQSCAQSHEEFAYVLPTQE